MIAANKVQFRAENRRPLTGFGVGDVVAISGRPAIQRRLALIGCLALLAVCPPCFATGLQLDEAPGKSEAESVRPPAKKKVSFVVMPIPVSSPAVGTGLVLPAILFYQPKGSARPWMTGAGALWTSNGSRAGGIFQKAYLGGDKFRLSGGLGRADLNLKFYGVGDNAASRDRSIGIEQKVDFALVQGLVQVSKHQFLGLRVRKASVDTTIPIALPAFPDLVIPPVELNLEIAGPGLVYQYDSRDNELDPSSGIFATGTLQWNLPGWGSDRDYTHFDGAINVYRKLGPHGVLAMRVAVCDVSSNAPFFDLCLYGANSDLRGYETGQYRDYTLLAAQAEYRWQFARRWGMVAFAGTGGVAPNFGDYRGSSLLPSGGLGLRFKASTAYNVNVRVDYAVGKHSNALYFGIGEAF